MQTLFFFPEICQSRRNMNTIWHLVDGNCVLLTDDLSPRKASMNHFKLMFEDNEPIHIQEKIKLLILYPSLFSSKEADCIDNPVAIDEVIKGNFNSKWAFQP